MKLAILGSEPFFKNKLPVGQLYFPSWDEYELVFRDIFERRYYTNHGPLVNKFETELSDFLNVKHAVCVSNATIGLCILIEAMGIKGRVIVPAFTFIATIQALLWCNIEPILCDVDPNSHHLDVKNLELLLAQGADGVLSVNLWGGSSNIDQITKLCETYKVPLFFDSAQSFGSEYKNKKIGIFGQAEVFSFHATKIVSAAEGGVITTNDDVLADKLRNVRSSYGVRKKVAVRKTANGRMSEAQAAIGIISLSKYENYNYRNKNMFFRYKELLKGVPGIKLIHPENVTSSNYQYLVLEVDEKLFGLNRDTLVLALQAENVMARKYFNPLCYEVYDNIPYKEWDLKNTKLLSNKVIQLPLGALISDFDIYNICQILIAAHENHEKLLKIFNGDD